MTILYKTVSLIVLSCLALAADPSLEANQRAFAEAHVFGDVIPPTNFSYILHLTYTVNEGEHSIDTYSGINLTKPDTSQSPIFYLKPPVHGTEVDVSRKLVIIGLDPDAPSPSNTKWSHVVHFMQGGVHMVQGRGGAGDDYLLLNRTSAILDYMGPAPPKKSTAHRYVFLVYHSTSAFEKLKKKDLPSGRKHFNLKKFVKKAKFHAPIAGTFFYVSTNPEEIGPSTIFAPQETHDAVSQEENGFVPDQVVIGREPF